MNTQHKNSRQHSQTITAADTAGFRSALLDTRSGHLLDSPYFGFPKVIVTKQSHRGAPQCHLHHSLVRGFSRGKRFYTLDEMLLHLYLNGPETNSS